MKNLYLLTVLLAFSFLSAQEIKLKKEIVLVDGSETFSYEKKAMGNELHVYQLKTKEELVSMTTDNNGTESKVDDTKKVTFTQPKITIQSKIFRGKNWEEMILLLLQEKVFNLKGEINADNLNRFKGKYDDGNINHVNRY